MTELLRLTMQGVIAPVIEVFDFTETPRLIDELIKDGILGRAVVRLP